MFVMVLLICVLIFTFFEYIGVSIHNIKKYFIEKRKKLKIKDRILNNLLLLFEKNKGLNDEKILIYEIDNIEYRETHEQYKKYCNIFLNYNDLEMIDCLNELEIDNFINIKSIPCSYTLMDDFKWINKTSYYCTNITELAKVKISKGGFIEKYNKRLILIFTSIIVPITIAIIEIIFR